MKYILSIDLAIRNSGIVLINENLEIIQRFTIHIPKKYKTKENGVEILNILDQDFKVINSFETKDIKDLDIIIELSPVMKNFVGIMGGVMIGLVKRMGCFNINKINYVEPSKWQSQTIKKYSSNNGSAWIKEQIRLLVKQDHDINNWTQDEIDAYLLAKWYVKHEKK